jgi:hypothetical protein
MKIDIKTMLLTFGVCILFAFTAGDILTVKPATPKNVIAITCDEYSAKNHILSYTKQGYILKGYYPKGYYCTLCTKGLLVMEKY